jgi:glycerophosphoryl diester phosphodiesterase
VARRVATEVKHWFTPAGPRVLAHRGLAIGAPENSLLAFVKAMAIGVNHLETDVHATSDGIAVLSHDPDLHRLTGVATPILELTRSDLKHVRLGPDERIATLADALHAFPDAFFNIDIKADEALEPTVAAVTRAHAVDRVLVTSFDDRRRRAAIAALPGVATSPSSPGVLAAALVSRLPGSGAGRLAARSLKGIDALQVPVRFRGVPIVTPGLIRLAHHHDVEVHVWTINDPLMMIHLLDLGVDGIITDRADLAIALLEARAPDPL